MSILPEASASNLASKSFVTNSTRKSRWAPIKSRSGLCSPGVGQHRQIDSLFRQITRHRERQACVHTCIHRQTDTIGSQLHEECSGRKQNVRIRAFRPAGLIRLKVAEEASPFPWFLLFFWRPIVGIRQIFAPDENEKLVSILMQYMSRLHF
jgi:hypothetical protein